MRIETTTMDDVWFGMLTVALVYLVMRTVSTLERVSKKVDALVSHIGAEVEHASNKLSSEANCIMRSLEKNAFGCKDKLLNQVENVELQCYRSKNGIAFGFGQKSMKKRKSHHSKCCSTTPNNNTIKDVTPDNRHHHHHHHHHSTLSIYKCIDRVLKIKYKWPVCLSPNKNKQSLNTRKQITHTNR